MPKSALCGAGVQLVTLPEGPLSPMLLRNSVLHLEDFYRRIDILRGFLGGGGFLSLTDYRQLLVRTAVCWDTGHVVRFWRAEALRHLTRLLSERLLTEFTRLE